MDELIKYMRALLLVQLHSGTEESSMKPEILLEMSGFSHKEIAEFLGKTQAAVSKTISRAKKK